MNSVGRSPASSAHSSPGGKPRNPVLKQISLCVEMIFALEAQSGTHVVAPTHEYELELRFGRKQHTHFDAHVPCYLALSLFQHLCQSARVALVATESAEIEYERGGGGGGEREKTRIVHTRGHFACTMVRKTSVMAPSDFRTNHNIEADVRVALERETRCGTLADCGGVAERRNGGPVVRRYRRSLRFTDSPRGADDFWRLDVTRLDNGRAYQLELELEFDRARQVLADEWLAAAPQRATLECEEFQEFAKAEIAERGVRVLALIERYAVRAAEHYDSLSQRLR